MHDLKDSYIIDEGEYILYFRLVPTTVLHYKNKRKLAGCQLKEHFVKLWELQTLLEEGVAHCSEATVTDKIPTPWFHFGWFHFGHAHFEKHTPVVPFPVPFAGSFISILEFMYSGKVPRGDIHR